MVTDFSKRVIEIILKVPVGKVATYGQIAQLAGNSKAARQISRILHSSSAKYDLPWHRVINSQGRISMRNGEGFEMQKAMLESEGIEVNNDRISLKKHQWEYR
ncbi:MAG: MGMT family protein [Candidatus Cloacimonetes bacterium]|jgi:methylated-DNA-protein-cysteine methyltransferase-like protein|nr:MGMT family protein [Candidatus Cloacimonadota bacterium]